MDLMDDNTKEGLVRLTLAPPIATIALNDPAKRNAMSLAMFDALDLITARLAAEDAVHIVLLRGEGAAFCAGFDLAAAERDPAIMPQFIERLSKLNRSLRRLPQVVVAAVQGAAIAGGCAVLTACDFVFVAADAKLGYPVHRIGVSPAVNIPMLQQVIGSGAARSLLLGGEIIDGITARRLGLASHLSANAEAVVADAMSHCNSLATKGLRALRTTKAWLNELDGSTRDEAFERSSAASMAACHTEEAHALLALWQRR
jgi:methylglutaconyl-CoA hydratase